MYIKFRSPTSLWTGAHCIRIHQCTENLISELRRRLATVFIMPVSISSQSDCSSFCRTLMGVRFVANHTVFSKFITQCCEIVEMRVHARGDECKRWRKRLKYISKSNHTPTICLRAPEMYSALVESVVLPTSSLVFAARVQIIHKWLC